jgi:hypothetical protein
MRNLLPKYLSTLHAAAGGRGSALIPRSFSLSLSLSLSFSLSLSLCLSLSLSLPLSLSLSLFLFFFLCLSLSLFLFLSLSLSLSLFLTNPCLRQLGNSTGPRRQQDFTARWRWRRPNKITFCPDTFPYRAVYLSPVFFFCLQIPNITLSLTLPVGICHFDF